MHGKVLLQAPLCHKEPARSKQNIVGGFGCDELVLYGIRELAEQFLGSNLDIEVDHSAKYILHKSTTGSPSSPYLSYYVAL